MAIKWGVIGAGGIAYRRTIPEGITKAANAELAAVMDVDKERTKEIAREHGVKYHTSEKSLLKDKDINAVYIATPVWLHQKQVIAAAKAGKHVLCEKPLAPSLKQCQRMIDACKENNVKLGLGFMMRFHSHNVKAREMVKQGLLGQPVFARAQLSCWYPPIPGAWRQDPKLGGGGSMIDMGNHCIDLLEFILDSKVAEVSCFTDNLAHAYASEDSAVAIVTFRNKAHGTVDNYFNIPDASSKNRLEVYGTKGSILAEGTIGQASTGEMTAYLEQEDKGYEAQQKRSTSTSQKIEVTPVNMYQAEIEHFSDCIEKNAEPSISGDDGLWSQKVMLACYKSAKTGKAMKL